MAPDETMEARSRRGRRFQMPGAGMPDFAQLGDDRQGRHLRSAAHDDEVVAPVPSSGVFERADLGPAGEQAREELATFMGALDVQASRFVEQRERKRARAEANAAASSTK